MIREFDTIAAIATPVANSGIGIIRISGRDTFSIIDQIFCPRNKKVDMKNPESYRIYYGNVVDGEEIIDECIVLIMKNPHSYTREDVAEIDCHGGVRVMARIYDLVLKKGARAADPGEFTKRAFLNGRIDLTQAEAVMDLIESKNEMARENSIRHLKGGFSDKIRKMREAILYEIAWIESALDDPENYDLTGYPPELKKKVEEWSDDLSGMADSYEDGRFIKEGIRTCIVGKPNAGKSSFLNALIGEERAIVTEIAGTTRDTLRESVTIDGITFDLVDTAGIRQTKDIVEKIGVERSFDEINKADLILFIMDMSREISQEDQEILKNIKDKKVIILLNKNDIINKEAFDPAVIDSYFDENPPLIEISAKNRHGLDLFTDQVKKMIFHGHIDKKDEIYVTNARHRQLLKEALSDMEKVDESIMMEMPEDFFTIDLIAAYEKLGLIIGEALEDDLANEIFDKFCTGK